MNSRSDWDKIFQISLIGLILFISFDIFFCSRTFALEREDSAEFEKPSFKGKVLRSDSQWSQVQLGGSLYDAGREAITARWSPGFQYGRRFSRSGVFINVEFDQSFDLTQDLAHVDIVHLGLGAEFLHFSGQVRSSLSAGAAFLKTDTDLDSRGSTGWYIDLRPSALRWALSSGSVIEFSPLTVDVSVPAPRGIPLILFSYFSVISIEFAEARNDFSSKNK